jgi:hypothetical protein
MSKHPSLLRLAASSGFLSSGQAQPSTTLPPKGAAKEERGCSDAAITYGYQREGNKLLRGGCTIFGSTLCCFHMDRDSQWTFHQVLRGRDLIEVGQGESQPVIS